MTCLYLLDTNIISELNKVPSNDTVTDRIKRNQIVSAISSVSWSESLFGMKKLPSCKRRDNLTDFYFNTVLETFPIIPFDEHAASIYSDIKSRLMAIGKPAPELDMQIAATAIANNLILVTRNVSDFNSIAEVSALMMENWFE